MTTAMTCTNSECTGARETAQNTKLSFLAAALGDAVGYPLEFMTATNARRLRAQWKGEVFASLTDEHRISDDTIMHLATARAITAFAILYTDQQQLVFNRDEFAHDVFREYTASLSPEVMLDDTSLSRAPGIQSKAAVKYMRANEYPPYRPSAGGNGAAMRTMCLGLALPRRWQLSLLIEAAVVASAATHNHPVAILGGVMTAVFTSYALLGGVTSISNWANWFFGNPLPNLGNAFYMQFAPSKFDKAAVPNAEATPYEWTFYYCAALGLTASWPWKTLSTDDNDIKAFYTRWTRYLKAPAPALHVANLASPPQLQTQWDDYWREMSYGGQPGFSGYDAPMMAYDALLKMYGPNGLLSTTFNRTTNNLTLKLLDWNLLMSHVAFHAGDSDSTATIAGAWLGALCNACDKFMTKYFKTLEYYYDIKGYASAVYGQRLRADLP